MATFAIFPMLELFFGRERIPKIGVVDVGAMSLGDETDVYQPLLKQGLCTVVGFEPVKEEYDKLVQQCEQIPDRKFFPYFIGQGKTSSFYLCNEAMTSSLYPPNTNLVEKFTCLSEVMRVVETSQVHTTRLDDILDELGSVDFIKLDVQGAELDVIKGGPNTLRQACVVHTEVEFVPLYKDQPLFADVDIALRQLGFTFHRFNGLAGRTFKPLMIINDPYTPISQHLWSDAVYVRDMIDLGTLSVDQLLKAAITLHEVYQSYDLVHRMLHKLEQVSDLTQKDSQGQTLSEAYFAKLTGTPRPPETK